MVHFKSFGAPFSFQNIRFCCSLIAASLSIALVPSFSFCVSLRLSNGNCECVCCWLASNHGIIVIAMRTHTQRKNKTVYLNFTIHIFILILFCCHVWFGVHFTFCCLECHIFASVRDLTHNLNLNIRLYAQCTYTHKHSEKHVRKWKITGAHIAHCALPPLLLLQQLQHFSSAHRMHTSNRGIPSIDGQQQKKKKRFTVSQTIYFSVNGVFIWLWVEQVQCTCTYIFKFTSKWQHNHCLLYCNNDNEDRTKKKWRRTEEIVIENTLKAMKFTWLKIASSEINIVHDLHRPQTTEKWIQFRYRYTLL